MEGRCHCGAVRVTTPGPPPNVTECRCSICRRYGALWAYYPVDAVAIEGATETYVWGRRHLAFHRCEVCGCVVAWLPRGAYPECGINARMLEGFDAFAAERIVEEDASI
ncbi:GFA family protein [Chelatococcus sambhunathii]|uniref:GFA family protein n=1 Tax=Chelatococcus sambhunathii TaxID=363953 RepID=A0ABU1DIL0_9HYPH|nr:GFA family protein [Chelatococcus sambhunathii]MDR4307870.1 GFA family protein [Chelatococcus sambhunathii]